MNDILNRFHLNEQGVTIVELIIAALLTVIVSGAALEYYISQHKTLLMETQISDMQQNARVALDEIVSTLRLSGYHTTARPAYHASTDSISTSYRNDSTSRVDTVLFYLNRTDTSHPTLMRRLNSQQATAYAENIEALRLTVVTPRLLTVTMTARGDKPDQPVIAGDGYRRWTLSTQVEIRNP